jgi:hypothetical protein
MIWRRYGCWKDQDNHNIGKAGWGVGVSRVIRVVLTLAHLDHNPENNSDDNLRLLCCWCHLNYDKLHHKETRATRKDSGRPLLV